MSYPFAFTPSTPVQSHSGELTEWPMVLVLKTNVSAMAPRVRIPYSPLIRQEAGGFPRVRIVHNVA